MSQGNGKLIKYSVNKRFKGKLDKSLDGDVAAGQLKRYTGSFVNTESGWDDIAEYVRSGFSICCRLKENKYYKTWKSAENFVLTDYAAIDIDHGMTLEEAFEDDFVKKYASLIYTTSSHTPDHHRFRIFFALPHSVSDIGEYARIVTPLIDRFKSDIACKDPHRGWYGAVGCQTFVLGNELTIDAVNDLKKQHDETQRENDKIEKRKREAEVKLRENKVKEQNAENVELGRAIFNIHNAELGEFSLTDSGNAKRLVNSYGHLLRYNKEPFDKWYIWNGIRWCPDKTNKIYEYVDRVVRDIYKQASDSDPVERKKIGKWAHDLESMGKQKAMIEKAETLQEVVIAADDMDCNPYLINTFNYTLDLSSGEIVSREHGQDDFLTKLTEVEYNPDAKCPRWDKFLQEIFNGNDALIQFVQRAIGYSLTGDISEQCFFFAYGTGKNGKSVFFNTIEMLFGDYFYKAPQEMIMMQRYNQIPSDVAQMKGKRFVVTSEVEEGKTLAEGRIKDLTGGDTIEARKMYGDWFQFKPTHKLWIFGNHKPNIKGTDEGIWRRTKVIPFTVHISAEKQRPMRVMLDEFRIELSGILNWALEGYISYVEKGLAEPDEVKLAVEEYHSEMDVIAQFIEECCFQTSDNTAALTATLKSLWDRYRKWCEDHGDRYMTSRRFLAKLLEKNYTKRNGAHNKVYIDGLGIIVEVNENS